MARANISCPKTMSKKVNKVLNSTLGEMHQVRQVIGSILTFMVRSPSFSDYCNKTFQKTLHQNPVPPASWAIHQWRKKVRRTGSVKRQKESEWKSILDWYLTTVQQAVQLQVNTSAEAVDNEHASCMKLLNNYWMPVRKVLPFASLLSFDRFGAPNHWVLVVWPMMMEAFDVMLSRKSVYVSRRLMAIEPMSTLNLLLVCELIHNAEWRDQNFNNILHHRFWAWDVSTCHSRNLYRTIKSGTL